MTVASTITLIVMVLNLPPSSHLPQDSSSMSEQEQENDMSQVHMLKFVPFTYENSCSASFLTLFAINNLYVFFAAYFYHPSKSALLDSRIVRDDPTVSMMNDSDEEIIYSSEMDHQPLNQIKLIDTQEDEDSD